MNKPNNVSFWFLPPPLALTQLYDDEKSEMNFSFSRKNVECPSQPHPPNPLTLSRVCNVRLNISKNVLFLWQTISSLLLSELPFSSSPDPSGSDRRKFEVKCFHIPVALFYSQSCTREFLHRQERCGKMENSLHCDFIHFTIFFSHLSCCTIFSDKDENRNGNFTYEMCKLRAMAMSTYNFVA